MKQKEKYPDLSKHDPELTLEQVRAALSEDGKTISDSELGRVLGVGRANVHHWAHRSGRNADYLIPTVHAYRLMAAYPDKFK